ncbi:NAD(P)/FAD-dependent oxidoreductase, partial [Mycobacterium intracellulare]|uniref:NAD(P)/FAD-dependent oxidoreductase n=1 Tax=Mycobacterium intracellulare TaxID=1767 RepID=UPI001F27C9C5
MILAMGSAPKALGVPGEKRLRGRGLNTTAKDAGFLLRDKDVAVVGGGDAAMEEALFLTGIARSITIIHHRDTFRSSPLTTTRVSAHDKVTVLTNTSVLAVQGSRWVTGLRLRQRVDGAER